MKQWYKIVLWLVGVFVLGYLIQLPITNQLSFNVGSSFSLPLSGKTIVIDPGHGGPDGGAVGKDDTQEKDISLEVSKKVQKYLQQVGAIVYLTRETDKDLASPDVKGLSKRKSEDIRNRLAFINKKEADFFITLHLNALPSSKWRGAQTFYNPLKDENKHLAEMIQAELIRNLENTNRAALAINNVYLLKHAEVPGALVEIGFLSNAEERELLKDSDYQQKVAASIYKGILRYITEEIKDEGEES
ncbi:N-acetylmuramoyl-L-alanine amidase CwlD [Virgibacillus pantothenticus]|uniref:N-acetylmuramoyl-L-alanine amidase n=1 Tax=Virgibacillus pantothenticus TaxID=1473 RepID=A0A0L0QV91_VIRPA|nr:MULTISPECIES: N-acetylmuramoyl-L-alanine amidase CwlD [Virgibacillus]API92459.1 N-acetylmuramoyl-L-alanine amidase CwlD [Virgibacillus sp. 6R]KNE22590.1 N-acetylmuramoyl-L-alanine amidase [Virgibacillus pantothenticus]MBS7427289.1 N-acetylmuramoyl-L-alanine amidase CwlD [Virgibacillus sp. 19R1-5]MBU8567065.1 N-acetylmuramoyl-L-alanine amidase CwlD [Virgibacillus pantothenticus]MBU8600637.1 N-acetylmuramoyl-L-alanine amidase CwlD [Virgibacillus pantothenticus]